MVRKTKKEAEAKRVKRSFGAKLVWVIDNLSKAQLAEYEKAVPDETVLYRFLMDAVDGGMEIKVTWDSFSDCYLATCIGAFVGYENSGYATGARSKRDVQDALGLLWYKVVVVAGGSLKGVLSENELDDLRG